MAYIATEPEIKYNSSFKSSPHFNWFFKNNIFQINGLVFQNESLFRLWYVMDSSWLDEFLAISEIKSASQVFNCVMFNGRNLIVYSFYSHFMISFIIFYVFIPSFLSFISVEGICAIQISVANYWGMIGLSPIVYSNFIECLPRLILGWIVTVSRLL